MASRSAVLDGADDTRQHRATGTAADQARQDAGKVQALRGHRCQAFSGPVLLLQSAGLAKWHKLLFQAWGRLLPELRSRQVAGTHGSIFDSSHVDALAGELLSFMRAKTGARP